MNYGRNNYIYFENYPRKNKKIVKKNKKILAFLGKLLYNSTCVEEMKG